MNLIIKYFIYDKKQKKNKEINENYEIESEEIQTEEELFKLTMNEYIINNNNLNEEEKTKLALKYQILTDYTSLFAEVELSEKITEEMKKEIIGNEDNNTIKKIKNSIFLKYVDYDDNDKIEAILDSIQSNVYSANQNLMMMNMECKCQGAVLDCAESIIKCSYDYKSSKKESSSNAVAGFFKSIGSSIKGIFTKKNHDSDSNIREDIIKEKEEKNEEEDENKELNIKDLINEQNFVEGYWEVKRNAKKVKEKYENEFKLLKELKNKNINDNIAITILIIYFINKEHPELLNELFMIIEKAKNYIRNNTKDSYESIIKEIGL